MIKNDIASAIEEKSELNKNKSLSLIEKILNEINQALAEEDKVEIRGFASFKVVPKKTGYGRDIRKNKQIKIQKGKRIKFKPGQDLENLK